MTEEADSEVKLQAFKKAIAKQTKVTIENITGKGVDIPMLGIRYAVKHLGEKGLEETQRIFSDPAFEKSIQFKLSTSQVAINLEDSYMGYGAVVPDGYGVAYNLQNDVIIFCIASFFSSPETCSLAFAAKVQESLLEIKGLFETPEE